MNSGRFTWALWVLLAAAIGLQTQAGLALLPADLLSADPPAHFTTGVMLHDFLKQWGTQPPLPFAECFYIQYPKVAFGHWPPLSIHPGGRLVLRFRGDGSWRRAGFARALQPGARRRFISAAGPTGDAGTAMAASALFLAYPVVRHQAWNIMSDLLLTGLTFLAVCSLADYLIRKNAATRCGWCCGAAWRF